MSIHPAYAAAILDGSKLVEFRKRPIADDVTHVVVYATAPVSAVVGAFTVADQYTVHPKALWRRFRAVAGIGQKDFMTYYEGRDFGTAIAIGNVMPAASPLALAADLGISRPPQSFQYLNEEIAGRTLLALADSEELGLAMA